MVGWLFQVCNRKWKLKVVWECGFGEQKGGLGRLLSRMVGRRFRQECGGAHQSPRALTMMCVIDFFLT